MTRRQRITAAIGLFGTLAALSVVLSFAGLREVLALLADGGWSLLWLVPLHVLHLFPLALAWWCLFPATERPRFGVAVNATWQGQSVNTLLPVANIGGDAVKARLAVVQGGVPSTWAAAAGLLDKTLQAGAVLGLMVLGVLLLPVMAGGATRTGLLWGMVAGCGALGLGIGIFIWLQVSTVAGGRAGVLAARFGGGAVTWTRGFTETLRALYRRHAAITWALALRIGSAVLLSAEVWVTAHLLGFPIGLLEAVAIRVIGFGIRGAFFFVWGGLGVQEGVFVILGTLAGHPAEAMVAISLATRVREILTSLPGLALWLGIEARGLLSRLRHR